MWRGYACLHYSRPMIYNCIVFLAADKENPQANKVVKIATKAGAKEKKYVRFIINEARALTKLTNSLTALNIPKIISRSSNPLCIVEEFIRGRTLDNERSINI